MSTDRLQALLASAASGNRICPVPALWDKFWKLIGTPQGEIGPPLILAGWAFSSNREKRQRFREHIEYAAASGLLDEAERFVGGLRAEDWHTCAEADLDRNYGAEEQRRKEAITDGALQAYHRLLDATGSPAFNKDNLGETLSLLGLLFDLGVDAEARMRQLRASLAAYQRLAVDCDPPLHHDAAEAVAGEIERMLRARKVELAVLEILSGAAAADGRGPGDDAGRAEIDAFVDEMHDRAKELALRGKSA